MEQEQSQQVPSQEQVNFLKGFLDFLVDEGNKEIIHEALKPLEQKLDELLEYPKQGGD